MGNIFKIIMTTILTCNVVTAFANLDGIELGTPVFGGSGCSSADSISVRQIEDGLSLRFEEYAAEVVKNGPRLVRSTCNLAIPLHIPEGISVSIIAADYSGYASLPKKAQARFSVEYFFAGSTGPKMNKVLAGEMDDEFNVLNAVVLESQVWSKCGTDTILRINSSLLLQAAKKRDEAYIAIDTADIRSGMIYKLVTRKCE